MVNDTIMRQTVQLLKQVFEFKVPTDALLSKFFRENRKLGSQNRSLIAETVYTILRNYFKLIKVINPQHSYLLIGYTWLKLMGISRDAVRELKSVNLGEIDKLAVLDMETIEFPDWLIARLSLSYTTEEIKALSKAMSCQAPLTLRVNTLKSSVREILNKLEQVGFKVKPAFAKKEMPIDADKRFSAALTPYSPYGIKLMNKESLMNNELFLQGLVEVQDEASQLAGMLLDPQRGEMVVDFCAGSGGKTLLFGMLMRNTGRIYAFDTNDRRLGNFTPRLARSGLSNVYAQVISNENDIKIKRLAGKIDRVFVDAPCLGFGTLRRNPDLKFRYNEQSLAEIVPKQSSILQAASRLVKPGGRLVYATCSLLLDENQSVINQFLVQNSEYEIVPIPEVINLPNLKLKDMHFLELNPVQHDTDGFFACVLRKKLTN